MCAVQTVCKTQNGRQLRDGKISITIQIRCGILLLVINKIAVIVKNDLRHNFTLNV